MPEELDHGPDSVNERLVCGGEVRQDGIHRVPFQNEILVSLGLLIILGLLVRKEVRFLSLLIIKCSQHNRLPVEDIHNCKVDPMS